LWRGSQLVAAALLVLTPAVASAETVWLPEKYDRPEVRAEVARLEPGTTFASYDPSHELPIEAGDVAVVVDERGWPPNNVPDAMALVVPPRPVAYIFKRNLEESA
jgi:hypothetical protein